MSRSSIASAVADAWLQALKWGDTKNDEVCVLLLGTALAPAGELAGEIADQRRKSRGAKVTLIPVDARVWNAHMPLDAPADRQDAARAAQKRDIIRGTPGSAASV